MSKCVQAPIKQQTIFANFPNFLKLFLKRQII